MNKKQVQELILRKYGLQAEIHSVVMGGQGVAHIEASLKLRLPDPYLVVQSALLGFRYTMIGTEGVIAEVRQGAFLWWVSFQEGRYYITLVDSEEKLSIDQIDQLKLMGFKPMKTHRSKLGFNFWGEGYAASKSVKRDSKVISNGLRIAFSRAKRALKNKP